VARTSSTEVSLSSISSAPALLAFSMPAGSRLALKISTLTSLLARRRSAIRSAPVGQSQVQDRHVQLEPCGLGAGLDERSGLGQELDVRLSAKQELQEVPETCHVTITA
jgi:hypothetical protein